jgi:hypothetical protein
MTEIDVFEGNEHIKEKDGQLVVEITEFPSEFIGTITQEFIEKDDEPGIFEEFVFKEIEEE